MDYRSLWSMYFAGIVHFQYHPGVPEDKRMSVAQAADIADLMFSEMLRRNDIWQHYLER